MVLILFKIRIALIFLFYTSILHAQASQFNISELGGAWPEVSAASDSTGRIIIVWSEFPKLADDSLSETGGVIYLQELNADRKLIGKNVRITAPRIGISATNASISMNAVGDYIITWKERIFGSGYKIIARAFTNDHVPKSSEISLGDENFIAVKGLPRSIVFSNGDFVVVWLQRDGEKQYSSGQFITSDGDLLGERFLVNNNGKEGTANIKYISDEKYIITWDRYAQIYTYPSTPSGTVEEIGFSKVYPLSSDTLLLVYRSELENDKLFGRSVTIDWVTIKPEFRIDNSPEDFFIGDFDFSMSKEGNAVVLWEDARNGYQNVIGLFDIYAQRMDASLNFIGNNFKFNREYRNLTISRPKVSSYRDYITAFWWEEQAHIGCPISPPGTIGHEGNPFIVAGIQSFINPISGEIINADGTTDSPPDNIIIWQNFPNPFNIYTTFSANLPSDTKISAQVFDLSGRLVDDLSNRIHPSGYNEICWQPKNLPSGQYLVKIVSGESRSVIKILLIK